MEFQFDRISDAWEGVSKDFLVKSVPVVIQGRPSFIMENILLHINKPESMMPTDNKCVWNHKKCEKYINVQLSNHEFEIGRLFHYGVLEINQFELIVERIRKNAQICHVALCMDPENDLLKRDSQTCLVEIDVVVRNRVLNLKAVFSMMNLFTYGMLDIYQLARVQEQLCKAAGCEKGTLCVFLSAVVMSDYNMAMLEEILRYE